MLCCLFRCLQQNKKKMKKKNYFDTCGSGTSPLACTHNFSNWDTISGISLSSENFIGGDDFG
eukprot:m.53348 g.53348  ORF g.53348 m.53348 type:complete len:62 (-) comp10861_c0_seq1:1260-1445(-)